MTYSDGCPFCAIAQRQAPASILYEDQDTLAFLDIHPIARGHTLVIPRAHSPHIFELGEEAAGAVIRTTLRVARALHSELGPDGLNLLQSNGRAAGQTIFHFHFHVVPRWKRDGLFLPHHPATEAERPDLEQLASLLRQKL